MNNPKVPSSELLAARRALETLKGVILLDDWAWSEDAKKWTLHCRLSPDISVDGPIPASTAWYVLVDPSYPWGPIKFFPDKEQGLIQTFPHQNYNDFSWEDFPWRDGDLCLNTSVHILGRHGYDIEPYGVHQRLRWHFRRALDWLSAASRGELVLPGEPFELPQFPGVTKTSETLAFCESPDSFPEWQNISARCGLVDLLRLGSDPEVFIIKAFRAINGTTLVAPTWGLALESRSHALIQGIWLRLNSIPALHPWQAPLTWGELCQICKAQGIDINGLLKVTVPSIRDGREHLALLGFAIPAKAGDAPRQMHWQAIKLPVLSSGTRTAPGFRTDAKGYWHRDRTQVLPNKALLVWQASENWHAEQLSTRGRFAEVLTSRKILLIGAGALGSALAELLTRAGVQAFTILDSDRFEAGNLARHTLGLDDLKAPKAAALAKHLNLTSPHASVKFIHTDFPPTKDSESAQIQQSEVILDCTGHDDVLYYLEHFPWSEAKRFFSISLGFGARRLFCFTTSEARFPHAAFSKALEPWLQREREESSGIELPREGIGCWHPVFPARADDIWMMAGIAAKYIESSVVTGAAEPTLTVFEQQFENGLFAGIRRISSEATHA